ncbi:MAG: Rrf2 family transcriptional regulator [Christensenella sp.]|uniref:RrF2 family transcriptional regulator n=1 Tax=Christensenella sp. TaxID=1935934 RepID=UPI002B21E1E6|nr:Rrf2 family transcriptional regulator [Christensenella sp.]MEA5002570.1 Rrf2 family transcriptional regulator [Christensenella sp.]
MQLTVTTNYAIRIILYLAETRRITTAGEISEGTQIAKKSLLATANKLKKANLIMGHMGVSGGYSLARAPENITILEIIETTEGNAKISQCLESGVNCPWGKKKNCPLRGFYSEVQEELDSRFARMTIGALMEEI